jgi:tetratricopeptide (TPR) repeat protein
VGQGQLSTLRQLQGKYAEAVEGHKAALEIFERQDELKGVATAWHQIGNVYVDAEKYDLAEAAYSQSLKTAIQTNDQAIQAASLTGLGNLYREGLCRLDEAINFYNQAASILSVLGDLSTEGLVRNNMAQALYKLQYYAKARTEVLRAIECKQAIGSVAEPWKSLKILGDIEAAIGNLYASQSAWKQARDSYLTYRFQGGQSATIGSILTNGVLNLLAQQRINEVYLLLKQIADDPEASASLKQLIQAMVAILNGSRNPALADDPALNYDDAAEVLFLLQRLSPPPP